MNSKIINKDKYNIHVYKTDKFKSIEVHVLLRHEFAIDEYLLSAYKDLLLLTSKKYPDKIDRYIKEEELYNTLLYVDFRKYGRESIIDYCIEFIDPKLVKDNYIEDAISFLFDVINNPLYDESKLDEIKEKLLFKYKRNLEDPGFYSFNQASKLYYEDPIDKGGYMPDDEEIKSITMDRIKNKIEEINNNSVVDIFVIGNVDDDVVDILDKYNNYKSINKEFNVRLTNPTTDKVKEKREDKKGLKQAKVLMLFNLPEYNYRESKALVLYNMILGNLGLQSRLFAEVREKHHLCYDIYSAVSTYEDVLRISTGVDSSNVDKTISIIKDVIDGMKDISDEEIDIAKNMLITSYDSSDDSISGIYKRLLIEEIILFKTKEEDLEMIKSITKEEILAINDKIKLNTLYVLKGEDNGTN